MLQYGSEKGYIGFRRALASFLEHHYKYKVQPDQLLITAGVSHGLDLVCRRLAQPGDVVLVEQPTYFLAGGIFKQCGLRAVPVPGDEHGLDVDALARMLDADPELRPRLLYVIPVHSNPRGVTLPPEQRSRLLALAAQHGFTILADEVYQLLSFPGAPPPPPPLRAAIAESPAAAAADTEAVAAAAGLPGASTAAAAAAAPEAAAKGAAAATGAVAAGSSEVAQRPLVVSLGSFSKIMAPGLRLGWVEAEPATITWLSKCAVLVSGGSLAPLSAAVVNSALELGLLQQHLAQHVQPVLGERCAALCDALRRHLPDCRFQQPSGGYFVWLSLPKEVDATDLLPLAAERHLVRFAPGPLCEGAPNCVRLSFSFYTPDELREGVRRLAAALQEYNQRVLEGAAGGSSTPE